MRESRECAGLASYTTHQCRTNNLVLGGVRGGHLDTALARVTVVGRATAEEDVAGHTPVGAPRVLDLVVVSTAEGAVTDGEDTVVEGGAALAGHDAAVVELERALVSLDSDGDGLLGDGRNEGILRVGLDVSVARDGGDVLAGGLASTLGGSVRVRGLRADAAVGLDPLEGVVHQAAVAALVAGRARAVNKLLLREGDKGASLDEVDTLDGAGGGEGPARAALALVLDGGDGTLGNPVNLGGDGGRLAGDMDLDVLGDVLPAETKMEEDRGERMNEQMA
jgi:hypothetical protein